MRTADERSIDELTGRFYAAFDNRGGAMPRTGDLRTLFLAGASVTRVSAEGAQQWTVDEFIAPREAMLTDGTLTEFNELETEGRTTFGGERIACRRSSYRKSGYRDGTLSGGSGRKLIHLVKLEADWRISAVLWEDDEDGSEARIDQHGMAREDRA